MNAPDQYEIRLARHLGLAVTVHFPEFSATHEEEGSTLLRGTLPDQAALHGVLARVRDLGLTLISVRRMAKPTAPPAPEEETSGGSMTDEYPEQTSGAGPRS